MGARAAARRHRRAARAVAGAPRWPAPGRCETIAHAKGAVDADAWFSVGLLSVSDALAGAPMAEVVGELPLADDVVDGARAPRRAQGRGAGGGDRLRARAAAGGSTAALVLMAYADAIAWADAHAAGAAPS